MGALWRVLDGVVHDVDDDLHHQPGVHVRHQHIVRQLRADLVLAGVSVQMGQSFREDVTQQLRFYVHVDAPVLKPGDGQQILHQIEQPHGVVVYGGEKALPLFRLQLVGTLHQNVGIAGDAGEGCPQVVGDGPQQIGP